MSQQINLLTSDLRQVRQWVDAKRLAVALLLTVLLLAVLAVWAGGEARSREQRSQEQLAKLKTAKDQLASLSKELSARKPNEKLSADLLAATAQLKGREEVMAYLERGGLGSSAGFAQFLRAFARQTPNGLWLTGFSVREGGRDMEIRGRMLQAALLPDYIRRLNSEAAFHGRSFASLDIRRAEPDRSKPAGPGGSAVAAPKYVEFVLTSSAPANAPAPGTAVKADATATAMSLLEKKP